MNTKIPKIILHCITFCLAISAGVMAIADTITPLLAVSPKLATYWPLVLAGASALDKFGSAILTALYKPGGLFAGSIEVNATNATINKDSQGQKPTPSAPDVSPAIKTPLAVILCAGLALSLGACSTPAADSFDKGIRKRVSSISGLGTATYDPATGGVTGTAGFTITLRDPSDGKTIVLPVTKIETKQP